MDIHIQNPNPGPNPHLVKAQEFVRLHTRELAAVGLFAFGCLAGYALGKGRASGPGQEVVMASMVSTPKPKAKKAPAKTSSATAKAIAKSKTTLAKADKPKEKSSKKR